MFCPKCGKINPDNETVCSGCGAELREETAVTTKKKGNGLKIVLAVIALLIVIGVVVFLLSGCGTGEIPKEHMTF